jgi:cytochrome c oxidase subunit 1
LIQHWLGVEGMPRRYADYLPGEGFTLENQVSTVGRLPARRLDAALPLQRVEDLAHRTAGECRRPVGLRGLARVGDVVPAAAAQLRHHPCIRSERPAFDLHHPEVAVSDAPTADKGVLDQLLGEPDIKQEGTGTTSGGTGGGSGHQSNASSDASPDRSHGAQGSAHGGDN